MAAFISKERFTKIVQEKKEANEATSWVDLKTEEVFKMIQIETKHSKYGLCWLATIEDNSNNKLKVFVPDGMVQK